MLYVTYSECIGQFYKKSYLVKYILKGHSVNITVGVMLLTFKQDNKTVSF